MNPYHLIEKALYDSRAVLMITRLTGKGKGKIDTLSRTIYTEKELLKHKSDLLDKLRAGSPHLEYSGDYTLLEPFFQKERMIIFGGGHIALPLCKMGAMSGFSVTVVDDRPSFANAGRFPEADEVICDQFSRAFDKLSISQNDFLVVITRGHKHDEICLREILSRSETVYTGMIGSKKRVALVFENLRAEGYDYERIHRICSPIGLPIGAVTPEEISISILSEIIQRKRKDHLENFLINRSDMEMSLMPKLTRIDEPCALVTVIETMGSAPRRAGAKMIVGQTGIIAGSVGGGCSESEVMHQAIAIIGTGTWEIVNVNLSQEDAEDEGMVCGGTMKLLVEDFSGALKK